MKRVVITGMGIYSTIGTNLDEVRESLYGGSSSLVEKALRPSKLPMDSGLISCPPPVIIHS